jgi:flagellin-specific chaperone FliS
MTYENLLIESERDNIIIIEKHFKSDAKGLCKGNKIGISVKLSTDKEKACVLSEELGHFYTSYGNILDQTKVANRKQELRARRWGYEKLVSLNSLISAFENGATTKYEIAEFLNVTEEFLDEAIKHYKMKFGTFYQEGIYLIYFEPTLIIIKSFY